MDITYTTNEIIQIDDARIVYRNFSGVGSKFNREGDRNFSVVIPTQEIADELMEKGWNVKIKPPRSEDEDPFMTLNVKIKFNARGPKAYLVSGNNKTVLDEDSIGILDDIDIQTVNLDIRPYDWEVNGRGGRTAYLQAIEVVQDVDRFASDN